jgi:hypothetical protein
LLVWIAYLPLTSPISLERLLPKWVGAKGSHSAIGDVYGMAASFLLGFAQGMLFRFDFQRH